MRKKLSLLLAILFCLLSLPGFAQEEDEDIVQEVQKEREKQIKAAQQLNEIKENVEASRFDPHAELKKLGYNEISAKALTDTKVLEVVKKMMDQSGLKNASPEEVKKSIIQQLNPRVQEFFKNHPKLMDMAVDVLRDDRAMSSLIGILMRKDDLKLYAVIYICLILLSWLTKKIFFKKSWSAKKTFGISLAISLSVTVISLSAFYKLFQKELTPLITIVDRHW